MPPEFRRDPVSGRWVIIAPGRQQRPHDIQVERAVSGGRDDCPFCPGYELMTPPEVLAYRPGGGAANTPGWDLRVVPNKFPALVMEPGARAMDGQTTARAFQASDRMHAIGAHEVIIETPDHDRRPAQMSEAEVERFLRASRARMLALTDDDRLKYILVFKNHGAAAGATLAHPHAQIIGLPIVPIVVQQEIDGARAHFAAEGRCVFCEMIDQQRRDGRRVIQEDADVIAIAPYAPRFAFETWLLPKRHAARFEDASPDEDRSMARLLTMVLRRLNAVLDTPPFNLVLHTSPLSDDVAEVYHWHVEILPVLTREGGLEWGSGLHVNPTPPEDAARALREIRLYT